MRIMREAWAGAAMKLSPALAAAALLAACGGSGGDRDAADGGGEEAAEGNGAEDAATEEPGGEGGDAAGDGTADDGGEAGDAQEEEAPGFCARPGLWRSPLEDYIAAVVEEKGLALDAFDHAVKDLALFDGRLYFGYGDWTNNLGPVEVRSFASPDGLHAAEFTADEESIDYYRDLGDTLAIPGVDATEDALVGNVFLKPSGGAWVKHRSLGYMGTASGRIYSCPGR